MVDCKAQLVEANLQIQQLQEANAKHEMEKSTLQETHLADQQYIVGPVSSYEG